MHGRGAWFSWLRCSAWHGWMAARRRPGAGQPFVWMPTSVILDAFATHPVVALGEGAHGNVLGHAFRLALIRDPRFAALVNDIVVESGSATYQRRDGSLRAR